MHALDFGALDSVYGSDTVLEIGVDEGNWSDKVTAWFEQKLNVHPPVIKRMAVLKKHVKKWKKRRLAKKTNTSSTETIFGP